MLFLVWYPIFSSNQLHFPLLLKINISQWFSCFSSRRSHSTHEKISDLSHKIFFLQFFSEFSSEKIRKWKIFVESAKKLQKIVAQVAKEHFIVQRIVKLMTGKHTNRNVGLLRWEFSSWNVSRFSFLKENIFKNLNQFFLAKEVLGNQCYSFCKISDFQIKLHLLARSGPQ